MRPAFGHTRQRRPAWGQRPLALAVLFLGPLLLASAPEVRSGVQQVGSSKPIDYNRDIKPILSENCYACHGPDHEKRKAGLRLDLRDELFKPLKSGAIAVVPGDLIKSELVRRITAADQDDRMPPLKSGHTLTPAQIETLTRWVQEGARWSGHWAYLKPERPPLPDVKNQAWARNPIDGFVLARLERDGLQPSPEADKSRLIRRASLDLRGLPPTVEEVDDFLYDNSPGAYDKLVDRFLKSPHYGERMAQDWLDLARYADSQGYHHDSHRDLWPWRDWVIKAFNDNKPFDQFTLEQLAGDLLPNPTRDQRIATGFHRNEMTTSEGGAMPEEYAVKYVVGRVDTTARVWLGTSLACAECHDHKYDPITQKEYYRFFAYFNTIAENGLDQDLNPVPRLTLDTPEQHAKADQFTKEIAALEKAHQSMLEVPSEAQANAQRQWQDRWRQNVVRNWAELEAANLTSANGSTLSKLPDRSILVSGPNPNQDSYTVELHTALKRLTGLKLEALPHQQLPGGGSGRGPKGEFVLSKIEVQARSLHPEQATAPPAPAFGNWFSIGPFKAESPHEGFEKAFGPETNTDTNKSYSDGKLTWVERPQWLDGELHTLTSANGTAYFFRKIEVREPAFAKLSLGSQDNLQVWWNGRKLLANEVSRRAAPDQDRVVVWLSPGTNKLVVKVSSALAPAFYFKLLSEPVTEAVVDLTGAAADFHQNDHSVQGALDSNPESGWGVGDSMTAHAAFFRAEHPFGFSEGTALTVGLKFESAQAQSTLGRFRLAVTTSEDLAGFTTLPENIIASLLREPAELSKSEWADVQAYYRETFVPEVQDLSKLIENQRKAQREFLNSLPVTMVMQEMEKPRDTFVLVRGSFQQHGEKVTPGVPESLFPMPVDYLPNRLGLARWLVHPDNPLVSRVTVNHFWQHYFGTGLVKTAEDFGSQGEWPSHPELLDWLATEFIRSGWDVKALQRLIVTSATYRQATTVSAAWLQRDPDDRLLGRFPRLRLDAEAIRDNALVVSGLFNPKIGGPSVYPYQPPGLWETVAFENTRKYEQSQGTENYRRGLYTYWRRSLPYPSLITFDAPPRETCTVRRPRTNTPLQALTLMNDPVYAEAARVFGQRILREGGGTLESRVEYAFRICLGRPPTAPERAVLENAFRRHLKTFEVDRIAASKLIHVGASAPPVELDICELAAWTVIGNTLLNLDETINKG
jgi:hypothetical protein